MSLMLKQLHKMSHPDTQITSELQAKAAAKSIWKNVSKPETSIEDEDLLRFLKKSEETFIIPQFEEAIDTGRINNLLLRIGMGGMQCACLTLIL